MRCVDVNVLIYAHRSDLPENASYRTLLEEWAVSDESLGIPDSVLAGFLRIVTNRRVFVEPTSASTAWAQLEALIRAPAVVVLRSSVEHLARFRELADSIQARGNDIADAYLAAYAVDHGATWFSADRGFARFPGLRWRHPLDSRP